MLQVGGALLGGQLSPILCCLAIARYEDLWRRSFDQFESSRLFNVSQRYVDNRLIAVALPRSPNPIEKEYRDTLTTLEFYPLPSRLEQEADIDALGGRMVRD